MRAELTGYELELTAEPSSLASSEGGYTPTYLRGTGTLHLRIQTEDGSGDVDVDVSTDGIGEEAALKRLLAEKVKEVSGSGVILTSRRSAMGDSYFVGRVLVTDTDFQDEYVVFRYQGESAPEEQGAKNDSTGI